MHDVREATQVALSCFEDLYGENAFSNILPEEVEREEEDSTPCWFITVGSTDENARRKGTSLVTGSEVLPRRYKRFKTNAETGDIVSVEIRSAENA
ncbi:MAG: hypothetical protein BRD33_01010 [Bacteroidetes bacterium QH_6_63_17]|nr:MAG: hypothetical protein BRD33_01010 [Bacteroidetes bacterium QH_6_63_17]